MARRKCGTTPTASTAATSNQAARPVTVGGASFADAGGAGVVGGPTTVAAFGDSGTIAGSWSDKYDQRQFGHVCAEPIAAPQARQRSPASDSSAAGSDPGKNPASTRCAMSRSRRSTITRGAVTQPAGTSPTIP